MIEGATEGWKTWEVWKRHSLRANWPEVDLLVSVGSVVLTGERQSGVQNDWFSPFS